jgi:hypothetical protein
VGGVETHAPSPDERMGFGELLLVPCTAATPPPSPPSRKGEGVVALSQCGVWRWNLRRQNVTLTPALKRAPSVSKYTGLVG